MYIIMFLTWLYSSEISIYLKFIIIIELVYYENCYTLFCLMHMSVIECNENTRLM